MKRKLFPLISILTLIVLLGTAATCNMCGLNLSTETTASTTEESQTDNTSAQVSETEETTKATIAEDNNEEKTTDTTKSSSSETSKSSSTDSQAIAPTIKLQIYEGPTYSQADDVCYYRVEAIITGSPAPTVTFSKDDSNGSFGSKKVQINLTKGSPSYTLTAKAKNSAGEATATLNLTWGCGTTNNPPKIDTISLISNGPVVTNTMYDVTAYAKDPDGDSLSYEWFLSSGGGVLKGSESNPVKWATPGAPGTYNIGVKVSDGKGGEDTKSMNINVQKQTSINLNLNHVIQEEGYVTSNQYTLAGPNIIAGDDSQNNQSYKGFMSFDISGLAGATIQDATLKFIPFHKEGDTSNLGQFDIAAVDYGAHPLVVQDFYLQGVVIQSFPANGDGNITCNSSNLKTRLQDAINYGNSRFQVRIDFLIPTDNDHISDFWWYKPEGINLNVTYIPK